MTIRKASKTLAGFFGSIIEVMPMRFYGHEVSGKNDHGDAAMHATLARKLKALRACKEAVAWAEGREWPAAWQECERGDWMLWLCGTKSWPERKAIVRVACDCAELALPIYEKNYPNDSRVRDCIETTRKWTCGEATLE